MEKHVTSFEISKQLREAGIRQESEFYWYDDGAVFNGKPNPRLRFKGENWHRWQHPDKHYSAFLSTEIGALLPEFFYDKPESTHRHEWELKISRCDNEWDVTYDLWDCSGGIMDSMGANGTLSDALATMLLLLIDKKIIDVKNIYEKREEGVPTQPTAVEK